MDSEKKIILSIEEYLFFLIKNKMYDVIEYFQNEEIIDKIINIAIEKFIRGGFPLIYLFFAYDKDKIKEFTIDDKFRYEEIKKQKIAEIIEFLKQNNARLQLTCFTIQAINGNYNAVILFITKKWAKAFAIPLKRIVHPNEGELFAVDENSLHSIEFKTLKSEDINFDLNFHNFLK